MQLKQIRKDIDLCVEAHGTFGFTLPALATIPSVRKGTAVAASSLIRADASAEADETPPVQHTMQSIIGMLVLCKRAATGRLARAVDQRLNTVLGKYDQGRTAQTKILIPLIVADVADYAKRLQEQLDLSGGGAVVKRLNQLAQNTQEDVHVPDPDSRRPDSRSMQFIIYARWTPTHTHTHAHTPPPHQSLLTLCGGSLSLAALESPPGLLAWRSMRQQRCRDTRMRSSSLRCPCLHSWCRILLVVECSSFAHLVTCMMPPG